MSYILAEIDSNGFLRAESGVEGMHYGCSPTVIHKTTVDLDKTEGIRVFDYLKSAKVEWPGPETDSVILNLDEQGAAANIWMAEAQTERLTSRLKIWSGCYGAIKVRKLNND